MIINVFVVRRRISFGSWQHKEYSEMVSEYGFWKSSLKSVLTESRDQNTVNKGLNIGTTYFGGQNPLISFNLIKKLVFKIPP